MITFQRISVEKGDTVLLQLRTDSEAVRERTGESILDVNRFGNWIAGLELIRSFVDFPLAEAVRPFDPVAPSVSVRPGIVTYEQDDAEEMVYIYLLYEDAVISLSSAEKAKLLRIDHQIVNPHCRFGLDSAGGLVRVRLPMADLSSPPEILLALLKKSMA